MTSTFCGPDGVAYSSKNHAWETDPALFAVLNKEFKFGLDAAASKKNALCKRFFTKKDNALEADWAKASRGKPAWCNPPYGRGLLRWAHTFIEAAEKITVVALVPARTDTQFFELLSGAGEIRLLRGRVGFYLNGKPVYCRNKNDKLVRTMAPFPSMVVVLGPTVQRGKIEMWEWRDR